jgi:hypothetical protein
MRDSAAILRNHHASSVSRSSLRQSCTFQNNSQSASLSIQEYGTCLHGFLLGLCIEGGLALGLYGLYYVGHLIR